MFNLDVTWTPEYHRRFNIPKNFIIFEFCDTILDRQRKQFDRLHRKQKQDNELKKIRLKVDPYYKKRTLDQNALMWSLYSVEANEMNAGLSGHKDQNVTADELYEADIKNYAPTFGMKLKKEDLERFKRLYNRIEIVNEKDGILVLKVTLGSSHFNTREMSEWIERQFNRMAYMGLSLENSDSISKYWLDWQQHLNDNEIIIHDDVLTKEQYRALHPSCEASGEFIGHGGGEIAHIQAIGMGGKEELEKNYSSNWLHIKTEIHREIIHGKGWEEFLKLYPHLTYKVRTALKREYKPLSVVAENANSQAEKEPIQETMVVEHEIEDKSPKISDYEANKRGLAMGSDILFTFKKGEEPDSQCIIIASPGDEEAAIKFMKKQFETDGAYKKDIPKICKDLGIDPEQIDDSLGIF